jgi:hypothetical protein
MRRTEIAVIASVLITAQPFAALSSRAQDTKDKSAASQASVPRASASKYASHAQQEGISIGAELLTRKQVAKEFVADVNRCCVVVQIAVFPKNDSALQLSLGDFSLLVEGSDIPIKPQSANVIAAILEKKNNSNSNIGVTTAAGVGYGSGTSTDSATGQPTKVHGVYTTASVAVAVGASVPPAVADREREAMAQELGEKGLPEASISVPVAGYLYFSIPKPKKDTRYRLEYSLKSGTIVLKLH